MTASADPKLPAAQPDLPRQRTRSSAPEPAGDRLCEQLDRLALLLRGTRRFNIGFPGAVDFDYTPLASLLATELLNNVGDPYTDGFGANHTKAFEREVVGWCADLFRAPAKDCWGYVSSGGSESNLYALHLARTLLPGATCYFSDAAHPSIDKASRLLAIPAVRVRASRRGELDYDDLHTQIDRHRDRPAIVVATIGTTMTEAVDDVRRITAILDDLAVHDRFIHADAALAGIPLALLDPQQRPGIDFTDGADSIAVSGHKFLGSPVPCSVIVTRASHRAQAARTVGYTGSPDTTISGSRSGHAPLILWYAISRHGRTGLHHRAQQARAVAQHAHARLTELGWDAFRHPHAFTVVLRTPPPCVLDKWVLATENGWSHVITMPGVTADTVDAFLDDMTTATTPSALHQELAVDDHE